MNTVRIFLDEFDVAVLFAIPHPGADLRTILDSYIFVHRDACPSFKEIRLGLEKAQAAGIVIRSGDEYHVVEDWYKRIHRHDNTAGNEIESLLLFQDEVLQEPLPFRMAKIDPITMEEYEDAVSRLTMR